MVRDQSCADYILKVINYDYSCMQMFKVANYNYNYFQNVIDYLPSSVLNYKKLLMHSNNLNGLGSLFNNNVLWG